MEVSAAVVYGIGRLEGVDEAGRAVGGDVEVQVRVDHRHSLLVRRPDEVGGRVEPVGRERVVGEVEHVGQLAGRERDLHDPVLGGVVVLSEDEEAAARVLAERAVDRDALDRRCRAAAGWRRVGRLPDAVAGASLRRTHTACGSSCCSAVRECAGGWSSCSTDINVAPSSSERKIWLSYFRLGSEML